MVQAVIFDMDGVIIDSEPFHWDVNKKIFRDLEITVCFKEYQKYIGVSNTTMWTDLKTKHRLPQSVGDLVRVQVSGNLEFMEREHFEPIDGVVSLLADLKKNAVAVGLASSSPYNVIAIVLKKFRIRDHFSAVVSGEDFQKGKPEPDIFLKAAQLLGTAPHYCAVVEDATHGVTAAKAAGMRCVGFANKNSCDQDLTKADLTVQSLSELSYRKISALMKSHG